jgi:hypothetical protein
MVLGGAQARTDSHGEGYKESAVKPSTKRRMPFLVVVAIAAPLTVALYGCGSGPGESESKMTSFTSSESKADTA